MIEADGFIVVRLPEFNRAPENSRGAQPPLSLGIVEYAGIDRLEWNEIDRDFYSGVLPSNLAAMRRKIWEESPPGSDFKVCRDLSSAIALLRYSNKSEVQNELVTVRSRIFEMRERLVPASIETVSLGVDLYCHGYGSLVREGLFTKPDTFADFIGNLNEHGLFDPQSSAIETYRDAYLERADGAGLEIVPAVLSGIDLVTISRVST